MGDRSSLKTRFLQAGALLLGIFVIFYEYYQSDRFSRILQSLSAPVVYWKDCISPYLMAKAILNGLNPYLSLHQLAAQFLPQANPADHPTPYPPLTGILSLPISFLSYEMVARIWLVAELLCLLTTLVLLLRWWGASLNPIKVAVLFALSVIWMPVNEELWQGQFMSCLMLLLVGAWLALRAGKQTMGGVLLGGLIVIKMIAWPIVLFLALRRQWRSVGAAAVVFIAANLLAVAVLGVAVVRDYYLKVGPFDARLWRPAEGNLSAWAWGIRLFEGAGFSFHISPWWPSPMLALIATYVLPLAVLLLGMTVAWRAANFDTAFGWLAGVSILLSPIAWYFYLLLAVIPLVVLARRLVVMGLPAELSVLALGFLLFLSIKPGFYDHLAKSFGTPFNAQHMLAVPFAAGLFTLIPTAALLCLLWLVWRTDHVELP